MLTLKTVSDACTFDLSIGDVTYAVQSCSERVPSTRVQLSCVSDAEEFFALEQEWNALFSQSDIDHQVFQKFAWLCHWHAVFIDGVSEATPPRLAVVIGRVEGKLVMAWPLVERRIAGVRTLEWMGNPVSQYGDVVLAPHEDQKIWFDAGLDFIKTELKPDALILNKVRQDSQFARVSKTTKVMRLATQQAPYLDLSNVVTFADFRATYSKQTRKTRSRKRRRFMEKPDARTEVISGGERGASEIIAGILAMKRQWLNGRNVVSRAFASTQIDGFMGRAVAAKSRSISALVSAFSFDKQLVAGEIGFKNKTTYFSHIAAYDLDHARLSAGVLQFEDTIRHCIEHDIHTIDMLAPADPYKLEWATGAVGVDDLALPLTMKGYVAVTFRLGWARAWMQTCALLLPKIVRTHLVGRVAKAL